MLSHYKGSSKMWMSFIQMETFWVRGINNDIERLRIRIFLKIFGKLENKFVSESNFPFSLDFLALFNFTSRTWKTSKTPKICKSPLSTVFKAFTCLRIRQRTNQTFYNFVCAICSIVKPYLVLSCYSCWLLNVNTWKRVEHHQFWKCTQMLVIAIFVITTIIIILKV